MSGLRFPIKQIFLFDKHALSLLRRKRLLGTMKSFPKEILEQRLSSGLGNPGGARGSLTRVAVKATEDEHDSSFQAELDLAHLELTKLYHVWQRQEIEQQQLEQHEAQLEPEIAAEKKKVEALRSELQDSLSVQSCRHEYSALAKICNSRHPTAAPVLQKEVDELEQKRLETLQKLETVRTHVHIRQGQLQNFFQSMFDLKQSLTEDLVATPEERDQALEKNNAKDDDDDNDAGGDPMEVEKSEGEEDEEDALYGDL